MSAAAMFGLTGDSISERESVIFNLQEDLLCKMEDLEVSVEELADRKGYSVEYIEMLLSEVDLDEVEESNLHLLCARLGVCL